MSTNHLVRNCTERDIPLLITLLKQVDLFWATGDKHDVFIKKLHHDPDSIIVMEVGGIVKAMCMIVYDPWASFIWHAAVHPDHQRQGYGQIIIEEAERRLRLRGTTSINGYVVFSNDQSLNFFKKRGYKVTEIPILSIEKVL